MWPWLPSKLEIPSGKQAGVNLWRSTLSSKIYFTLFCICMYSILIFKWGYTEKSWSSICSHTFWHYATEDHYKLELKIWRKKVYWQNFDQVSVALCRFLYCQRHCSPDGQVSHPLLLSSCEKLIFAVLSPIYVKHLFGSDFLLLSCSPSRIESDFTSTISSSSNKQWAAVTTQVLPI